MARAARGVYRDFWVCSHPRDLRGRQPAEWGARVHPEAAGNALKAGAGCWGLGTGRRGLSAVLPSP